MNRDLLLFAALCIASTANSQSWCPPNAQWNFLQSGLGQDGYVVRTYSGDSLFQGRTAQRIHETGYMILYWTTPEPDTLSIEQDVFTARVDSTLLIWVDWAQSWDTLFRFDAQIGDAWYPAGYDDICQDGSGRLLVVDTGHTTISGRTLRTWEMNYTDAALQPLNWGDTFTERLGFHYGFFLPPGCLIAEGYEEIRCYTDDEIGFNDVQWPYGCASVVTVPESREPQAASIAPNPGLDSFSFLTTRATSQIEVYDAAGRTMLVLRTSATHGTIDCTSLPSGTYFIRLSSGTDEVYMLRWMKL